MVSAEPRVALVTGTNRGTGYAIAEELTRRGYALASLNRTIRGEGWLRERRCDLADPEQIATAVDDVLGEYGRLDAVVANAVDRPLTPLAELEPADWDRGVAVNLSAVFHLIRTTLPALRAARGVFLAMGSHAGSRFFEGGAAYSAPKAALKALVETLLLEERRHGVRAALISPGAIANLPGDACAYKMTTASVARCVGVVIEDFPVDLVAGELEIRPARLPVPEVTGLDRLAHV
jgi:NAD(P)-dependent dehydrogenase (short-subunit alcohol dehydrogenase family)